MAIAACYAAVTIGLTPLDERRPGRRARIVTTNAKAALEAVDATPQDVVMARVYVVDLNPELMEEEMMPHLLATFDGAQPSLTVIGVAALAAPNLQLEMEMIVRLPD